MSKSQIAKHIGKELFIIINLLQFLYVLMAKPKV